MKVTDLVYDLIEANVRESVDCLVDEGVLVPCENPSLKGFVDSIEWDLHMRGLVIGYSYAKKLIEEITDVDIFDMINTVTFEYDIKVEDYESLANVYFDHVMYRDGLEELLKRTIVKIAEIMKLIVSENIFNSLISIDDLDYLPFDEMTLFYKFSLHGSNFIVDLINVRRR